MIGTAAIAFESETAAFLSEVLDDAWNSVPPRHKPRCGRATLPCPCSNLQLRANGTRRKRLLRDLLMALAAEPPLRRVQRPGLPWPTFGSPSSFWFVLLHN